MIKKYLFLAFVILIAGMNLATIRRAEDPIRDTQTDAILYQQKMEEEKDGKKGPLAYNVKYNPSDTFLTDPPFAPETEFLKSQNATSESSGGFDWWEEPLTSTPEENSSSVQSPAFSSGSAANYREQNISGEPTTGTQESDTAGNDDYWW